MNDLIIGCGAIAAGIGGIIATAIISHRLPAINARRRELDGMTELELCAELTRCTGAIMVCDRRGMRHAHRAMRPVMRALRRKKKTARTGMRTVYPERKVIGKNHTRIIPQKGAICNGEN